MKELQASGEIPPQVKLVTASGADLTREIADADGFVGGASQRRRLEGRQETALGAVVQRGRGESAVSFRQHHDAGQRHRAHQQPHRGRSGTGRSRLRHAADVDAATAALHGEPGPGEVAGGQSGHPGPERQDRGGDRRRRRGLQYRDARLGVRDERDWRGSAGLSVHADHQEVCEAGSVGRGASAKRTWFSSPRRTPSKAIT